jgi:hypothetical protein
VTASMVRAPAAQPAAGIVARIRAGIVGVGEVLDGPYGPRRITSRAAGSFRTELAARRGRPDGTQRLGLTADAPPLRRQRPQRPRPPHLRPHHDRPETAAPSPHRPSRAPHPDHPGDTLTPASPSASFSQRGASRPLPGCPRIRQRPGSHWSAGGPSAAPRSAGRGSPVSPAAASCQPREPSREPTREAGARNP